MFPESACQRHGIPRSDVEPGSNVQGSRRRRAGRRRRHHRHLPAVPRPGGRVLGAAASRPAAAWAAPGTGTATRARASTPRATRTPTCSRRSCSRSGSGRSTSRSSRRPSATSTTSSTGSTCGATSGSTPAVTSAVYDEPSGTWTVALGDGTEVRTRFLVAATGVLSVPYFPDVAGPRRLPGRVVPHRPVAGDARRLRGQARRRDRHRVERRAADPVHRGRGRLAHRVPAHRQLVHAAQQRADHRRGAGAAAGRLRSDPRDVEHVAERLPAPRARPGDLRRLARGAAGVLREDVEQPRLLEAHQPLHRPAVRPRGERRVVRVHRREDPRHRPRSADRGEADPEGPPLRREAAAVRDRLLRDVQRPERLARRPRPRRRSCG